ncbi:MAG: deoxyribose-phosphate aldolase [Acidobacteria bacterium]|nr:MAG: deoxyribose-phosphate aldolase [Acidobacteriota bacterium]PYV03602.1 MAG: deoxyribose-phosphate aldolase [Acidobacteriota bacterium]
MKIEDARARLAKLFDHSIVRPNAIREDVLHFAETAVRLKTATLTVQPHYIRFAAELLKSSGVLLGTVVGFPHGNETSCMKGYQAKAVLDLGAEEIDMVMNIPALKNGEEKLFIGDIEGVIKAARGVKVKVITENCYLTQEEKRRACRWIARTGAHFVKTSTAYGDGGAILDDVRLMYQAVEGRCQVKAAGGIRTLEEILEYLKAGARRFGSTRTDQFVRAFQELPEDKREAFSEFLKV